MRRVAICFIIFIVLTAISASHTDAHERGECADLAEAVETAKIEISQQEKDALHRAKRHMQRSHQSTLSHSTRMGGLRNAIIGLIDTRVAVVDYSLLLLDYINCLERGPVY